MRILFDTNVILDLLLNRVPFSQMAMRLVNKVEMAQIIGVLCATTITTIHYVAGRVISAQQATKEIEILLKLFEIASVNRLVLDAAISSKFPDFEDAIIYQAAKHHVVQGIVTRNMTDFQKASMPVYKPEELLNML